VVAMVGAGLATTFLQARAGKRRWEKVQERYRRHLIEAEEEAERAAAFQRDGLDGLYPGPTQLPELVRSREGLWERRPADDDFGFVRLGIGPVPADRPVVVHGGDGPLAEPEPDLANAAESLVARTATLPAAPVAIPPSQLGAVAVVGHGGRPLVGAWLASRASLHAPGGL